VYGRCADGLTSPTVPVAVITDSTACIPDQLAAQWDITVVQLQLKVGDRVDDERRFDRGELAEALRAHQPVATAPPDPGAFFWTYQDAVSSGADAIVSLHISGKLSATAAAARQAAEQIRVPVHVLDTQTLGMSLGFAVLSAGRAAAAGGHPRRVIEAAGRRCQGSAELVYVDTLDYLRRGGRIGGAAALLGSALSVKPLITVRDGEVTPVARVPGSKRALAKLVEHAAAHAGHQPVDVAVCGLAPGAQEAAIAQRVRERIPQLRELVTMPISTVISAHVGPGAVGITVSPAT
jgi:DegV family protein with EDD domain